MRLSRIFLLSRAMLEGSSTISLKRDIIQYEDKFTLYFNPVEYKTDGTVEDKATALSFTDESTPSVLTQEEGRFEITDAGKRSFLAALDANADATHIKLVVSGSLAPSASTDFPDDGVTAQALEAEFNKRDLQDQRLEEIIEGDSSGHTSRHSDLQDRVSNLEAAGPVTGRRVVDIVRNNRLGLTADVWTKIADGFGTEGGGFDDVELLVVLSGANTIERRFRYTKIPVVDTSMTATATNKLIIPLTGTETLYLARNSQGEYFASVNINTPLTLTLVGFIYGRVELEDTDILDGQVTTDKLADNAVTNPKIADDAITARNIADGAIEGGHIAASFEAQITNAHNGVNGYRRADQIRPLLNKKLAVTLNVKDAAERAGQNVLFKFNGVNVAHAARVIDGDATARRQDLDEGENIFEVIFVNASDTEIANNPSGASATAIDNLITDITNGNELVITANTVGNEQLAYYTIIIDDELDESDTAFSGGDVPGNTTFLGDVAVHGEASFRNSPILPSAAPTEDNEAASKGYVDGKEDILANQITNQDSTINSLRGDVFEHSTDIAALESRVRALQGSVSQDEDSLEALSRALQSLQGQGHSAPANEDEVTIVNAFRSRETANPIYAIRDISELNPDSTSGGTFKDGLDFLVHVGENATNFSGTPVIDINGILANTTRVGGGDLQTGDNILRVALSASDFNALRQATPDALRMQVRTGTSTHENVFVIPINAALANFLEDSLLNKAVYLPEFQVEDTSVQVDFSPASASALAGTETEWAVWRTTGTPEFTNMRVNHQSSGNIVTQPVVFNAEAPFKLKLDDGRVVPAAIALGVRRNVNNADLSDAVAIRLIVLDHGYRRGTRQNGTLEFRQNDAQEGIIARLGVATGLDFIWRTDGLSEITLAASTDPSAPRSGRFRFYEGYLQADAAGIGSFLDNTAFDAPDEFAANWKLRLPASGPLVSNIGVSNLTFIGVGAGVNEAAIPTKGFGLAYDGRILYKAADGTVRPIGGGGGAEQLKTFTGLWDNTTTFTATAGGFAGWSYARKIDNCTVTGLTPGRRYRGFAHIHMVAKANISDFAQVFAYNLDTESPTSVQQLIGTNFSTVAGGDGSNAPINNGTPLVVNFDFVATGSVFIIVCQHFNDPAIYTRRKFVFTEVQDAPTVETTTNRDFSS